MKRRVVGGLESLFGSWSYKDGGFLYRVREFFFLNFFLAGIFVQRMEWMEGCGFFMPFLVPGTWLFLYPIYPLILLLTPPRTFSSYPPPLCAKSVWFFLFCCGYFFVFVSFFIKIGAGEHYKGVLFLFFFCFFCAVLCLLLLYL